MASQKEAVLQNEQQLRAIFNQAAVGIALAGMDGRFIELNRKFAEILGYSDAELRALTFTELTHPEDRAVTSESVRQLLAGEIPEYSLEKRYLRKDGRIVWSLTTVTVMRDEHDQPQRFIGVIEDITRRKEAEAALLEETRILELLNQTGKLLASQLDLKSLLQAVTDAARQLSGAQFGAFFYNTTDENGDAFVVYTLSGAPREAFDAFGKPRATALFGPTFRGEAAIRIGDVLKDPRYGTIGPHHGMPPGHLPVRSYLAVPVKSRSGEVIGGLFFAHSQVDVFTERAERLVAGVAAQAGIAIDNARLYDVAQRAAEERKGLLESERAARTAAERLSEVKDEFLATLSHELRTPLNAILGWAQVLRAGRKGEADYLRGLETIERNARVQTQLIEDLLDMSRITAGKIRLDVQHVDAIGLIDAATETVKPAADAKNIRIERQYDRTLTSMSGDPARLQQVIWNLLSNAIKFTPAGGQVRIALHRAGGNIEIVVSDTGIGIKPEFLPHLFERFRQGDSSSTRRFGGLGLGLSIVKSLVELHGGTVWADSPGEGRGTTVKMLIPLVVPQPVREDAGTSPVRSLDLSMVSELAGLKLLVVEDQADARELIQRVLEDSGAEVLTASNAAEALALVRAEQPDILVSDIGMPEGDGFDLLRSIRALGPEEGGNIPAIAVTAFARSEDRTRALRAGFLVHVAKPLDAAELVATVASVAGRLDNRSVESTSGNG